MAKSITSILLLSLTMGHNVNGQDKKSCELQQQNCKIPKLIVFDLDETLWPYNQEDKSQPFRELSNGSVVDDGQVHLEAYPEANRVLTEIYSFGIPMAVASKTDSVKGASSLIELFGWTKYFRYTELQTGTKLEHFARLKNDSAVDYHDMVFFDNEQENIDEISKIGVTSILVNARIGMTVELLRYGLDKFEEAIKKEEDE